MIAIELDDNKIAKGENYLRESRDMLAKHGYPVPDYSLTWLEKSICKVSNVIDRSSVFSIQMLTSIRHFADWVPFSGDPCLRILVRMVSAREGAPRMAFPQLPHLQGTKTLSSLVGFGLNNVRYVSCRASSSWTSWRSNQLKLPV